LTLRVPSPHRGSESSVAQGWIIVVEPDDPDFNSCSSGGWASGYGVVFGPKIHEALTSSQAW